MAFGMVAKRAASSVASSAGKRAGYSVVWSAASMVCETAELLVERTVEPSADTMVVRMVDLRDNWKAELMDDSKAA